jgi:hypothetical protein
MHAPSLTAAQLSGLRGLNGQLTQLLGQLDAQAVAKSAKQGRMRAGAAAAGTSTAAKAATPVSRPWPAEFEISMANAKLRNVPISQLNSNGITMFAESYRSNAHAALGVEIPDGPGTGGRLAQWKKWVQSKAGPATTGDTYVPFAMLSTSAQHRMLKGFWERKRAESGGVKGKGEAPTAGSMRGTAAAAASNPFADGAAAAAAGEDNLFADGAEAGLLRYTADFMKTLRAANAQRPAELKAGLWDNNQPDGEMPDASA